MKFIAIMAIYVFSFLNVTGQSISPNMKAPIRGIQLNTVVQKVEIVRSNGDVAYEPDLLRLNVDVVLRNRSIEPIIVAKEYFSLLYAEVLTGSTENMKRQLISRFELAALPPSYEELERDLLSRSTLQSTV